MSKIVLLLDKLLCKSFSVLFLTLLELLHQVLLINTVDSVEPQVLSQLSVLEEDS